MLRILTLYMILLHHHTIYHNVSIIIWTNSNEKKFIIFTSSIVEIYGINTLTMVSVIVLSWSGTDKF